MKTSLLYKTAFSVCAILAFSFSAPVVPVIKPRIVRVLPHYSHGFTQGLLYHNGLLYESTGLHGKSGIYILELQNGKILQSIPLPGHFGESIAALGDRLLQLTWKAGKALVYRFPSLELVDTIRYNGEGWGLACDSRQYIMSNGSDTLYFRDSKFKTSKSLPVRLNGIPVANLNELEYAYGKIFANVWYKKTILEIDPQTGSVTRIIDCSPLFAIEKPSTPDKVLNGIAFDPGSGFFYLTGKNWKYIFETALSPEKR